VSRALLQDLNVPIAAFNSSSHEAQKTSASAGSTGQIQSAVPPSSMGSTTGSSVYLSYSTEVLLHSTWLHVILFQLIGLVGKFRLLPSLSYKLDSVLKRIYNMSSVPISQKPTVTIIPPGWLLYESFRNLLRVEFIPIPCCFGGCFGCGIN